MNYFKLHLHFRYICNFCHIESPNVIVEEMFSADLNRFLSTFRLKKKPHEDANAGTKY